MRAILVLLASVVALVIGGLPVSAAGGWAVTYLDPRPARFEGGTPYALGFWVLQHGTHPFEGDLGGVGLRLTGADGKSMLFDGTALPEAGHYATSVVVPEGVWKVEGVQGRFQPYDVGTLTVPGELKINPVPPDLVAAFSADGRDYWGAVRPPGFPRGEGAPVEVAQASPQAAPGVGASASSQAVPGVAASASSQAAPAERAAGGVPAYTLLLAAAGGALLAAAGPALLGRRRREPEEEPDPSADTVIIPG
ncbi:hypothetical protein SAMN05444920_102871 [Nonomuraea solani]|uniref:Uncharacterized protein n=1 Tax=Nonomuraea solani TaxID=1144553 RepID=A0A1H5ZWD9_9ACTN|nr:hypothetical protein [Nonomuraea solani]SEG39776.1 hypothetical protein SAMN05444920_102871 [Nonomuraea solani]